jgi:hypothetical protein
MKKLLAGLLFGLGLAASSQAAIVIEFSELDFEYERTSLLGGVITDSGGAAGDTVVNVLFIDDVTNTIIGTLANAQVDFQFNVAALTAPLALIAGESQFFNISSGGFFLNLGSAIVGGLIGPGGNLAAISLENAPILAQSLPFGITLSDPAYFNIEGHIGESTIEGRFIRTFRAFDAEGTGSIRAPGEVPEPGILSLLGIGLLGLAFARRARKQT